MGIKLENIKRLSQLVSGVSQVVRLFIKFMYKCQYLILLPSKINFSNQFISNLFIEVFTDADFSFRPDVSSFTESLQQT